MIVFGFPPRAGSGIQRIVKFVEFLPQHDWEPIILTIPRWGNDISDDTWEKNIPAGTKIYRIFSLDPMRILLALKNRRRTSVPSTPSTSAHNASSPGLLAKLKDFYDRISIPDSAVWWIPSAVICGIYLIIRHNPDLIFTTSGPYGTSLAGLLLKKISGIPWIAEFRDPWTKNPLRKINENRRNTEESMQKSCLRKIDGIIATTEPTLNGFLAISETGHLQKSAVITNGFSAENFPTETSKSQTAAFKIVYTGMFYGDRSPEYFFDALKRCCDSSNDFRDKARVTIAGTIPDKYSRCLNEEPLRSIVEILGYVSHEQSINLINDADLLYLFLSKGEAEIYPAKLFEYLAARKNILAGIPPEGITAGVIDRFNAGVVTAPDDIESMRTAILNSFESYIKNGLKTYHSLTDIQEYEWQNIVGKLSEFFKDNIKPK